MSRTWWSERFFEALARFGMADGLKPGRLPAKQGAVLSLSLSTGIVTAAVQGLERTPYRCRIAVKAFEPNDWARLERALSGQARFAAALLSGRMPLEIESVLDELGLTLFPQSQRELTMDCSCIDWQVPCKHLAAACHVLAERFDQDPFQILAWRGRGRDELLDRLREQRSRQPAPAPTAQAEDPASFWLLPEADGAPPQPSAATRPDALLDQLGPLSLTAYGRPVIEALRPMYRTLSRS
ncbi:hypothetical protein D5S17_34180 [Pseudonocardiaceae bacterium YIM PH 21723]|nr:hypothetical protein D5S17_34180 [Pseudonocardiaceae bacterium YIM PH 21723]